MPLLLPVDSRTNAYLFYTFYEASHPLTAPADTPPLLWLTALQSFFDASPTSFRARPFFLFGESYAGNGAGGAAAEAVARAAGGGGMGSVNAGRGARHRDAAEQRRRGMPRRGRTSPGDAEAEGGG
ncbi:hypothetical protein ZWY2020_049626 [Hordeum vulgare]|nr:hypothetical protein ZWY2020_049626 [Hordeum vulgare]